MNMFVLFSQHKHDYLNTLRCISIKKNKILTLKNNNEYIITVTTSPTFELTNDSTRNVTGKETESLYLNREHSCTLLVPTPSQDVTLLSLLTQDPDRFKTNISLFV